jgi:hypothetical protein
MHRRVLMVILVTVLASVAGCSGSSTSKKTASSPFLPPTSQSPGLLIAGVVENLTADPAVVAQLVSAGAAHNSLSAADYTGLVAGSTFYAYDQSTATHWAGAALDPLPTSQPAQVSVQDDGSYLLFSAAKDKPWRVYDVGLSGIEGTSCPVKVPVAVLTVWDWAPNSCRPPT